MLPDDHVVSPPPTPPPLPSYPSVHNDGPDASAPSSAPMSQASYARHHRRPPSARASSIVDARIFRRIFVSIFVITRVHSWSSLTSIIVLVALMVSNVDLVIPVSLPPSTM